MRGRPVVSAAVATGSDAVAVGVALGGTAAADAPCAARPLDEGDALARLLALAEGAARTLAAADAPLAGRGRRRAYSA